MRSVFVVVANIVLAGSAAAQTTWLAAGGGNNLQLVINQASPGDEILVVPGTYDMPFLDKGVTVRPDDTGPVILENASAFHIWQIPAGQRAHLIGLQCPDVWIIGGGAVTLEDCEFRDSGVVMSVAFSTVHLERCLIVGEPFWLAPQAGVVVNQATLTAVDTTIRGAAGQASPAVAVVDATMIGTGLDLEGGTGPLSASAVTITGASTVRLSDSLVTGGGTTCAITGGNAECTRCQLSSSCGVPTGSMLGLWADGGVEPGQTYTLNIRGEPNAPVLLFGSNDVDFLATPLLQLPFLLGSAGCFAAAALQCDATGDASVSWLLPNAGAVPPFVGVWFQGVSGTSFPLSTSTVVGGVVRR